MKPAYYPGAKIDLPGRGCRASQETFLTQDTVGGDTQPLDNFPTDTATNRPVGATVPDVTPGKEAPTGLSLISTAHQREPEFNTDKGVKSVRAVYALLRSQGHKCRIMPTSGKIAPYDLLVDGKHRVEVKVSSRNAAGEWGFNLHRHGFLDEESVDAYILRLENVPGFKWAIHLVIPAPVGRPTVVVSLRSLITRYARYYNRFDYIGGKNRNQEGAL